MFDYKDKDFEPNDQIRKYKTRLSFRSLAMDKSMNNNKSLKEFQ